MPLDFHQHGTARNCCSQFLLLMGSLLSNSMYQVFHTAEVNAALIMLIYTNHFKFNRSLFMKKIRKIRKDSSVFFNRTGNFFCNNTGELAETFSGATCSWLVCQDAGPQLIALDHLLVQI